MLPPVPPIVNEGRTIAGKPICSSLVFGFYTSDVATAAVRHSQADCPHRLAEGISVFGLMNRSADAPISLTPYFSSTPRLANPIAVFNAVCPPMVGKQRIRPFALDHFLDNVEVIGST